MTEPLPFDAIEEARRQWEDRWPAAAPAMATATSVMRAQQIVLSAVDGALRPFGLTFARFEALTLLSFTKEGRLPMGKIGQRLMIHPTSVTNVIDRLAADGLVERVPHPSDRRTTLAQLTPAGRALVLKATKVVNAIEFGLGGMTVEEMDDLAGLVRSLRVATGDFHTP
jgi:DNA-binding MarR family transcriptional regulator